MKTTAFLFTAVLVCGSAFGAEYVPYYASDRFDYYYYDSTRPTKAVRSPAAVQPAAKDGAELFVSIQQRFVRARSPKIPAVASNTFSLPYTVRGKSKPTSFAVGYRKNTGTVHYGFSLSAETERYKSTSSVFESSLGLHQKSVFTGRTFGAAVFGGINLQDGYYVKGSAFAGYQYSKLKSIGAYIGRERVIDVFSDKNNDGIGVFGASAEFGKAIFLSPAVTVTPHAGADYSYSPDYEYGSWVKVARQNHYLEIPLGVRVERTFSAGVWNMKSLADVTALGSLGRKDIRNTGYSTRTGDEWRTYGIGGGHYGIRLKAGLEAVRCDRLTFRIDYTYEGRKRYYDHRISVQAGLSF